MWYYQGSTSIGNEIDAAPASHFILDSLLNLLEAHLFLVSIRVGIIKKFELGKMCGALEIAQNTSYYYYYT